MTEIFQDLVAHINLKQISKNYQIIKKAVGPKVAVMAIVKANAYGHGDIAVSKHLYSLGVRHFGVARLEEALPLRQALPECTIVILSPINPQNYAVAIKNNITLTVADTKDLNSLNRTAAKIDLPATIHLKVETGLHRSGLEPEKVPDFIRLANKSPFVHFEGVFTHFAKGADPETSLKQLSLFTKVIKNNPELKDKIIHVASSSSIFRYHEAHFNLVRPGLSLYLNTLTLTTAISRIHQIGKGDSVGYDHIFTASKKMILATLRVGYGDGLRRAPQPWPYVLINQEIAPVIGRISMDQMVVDISNILKTTLKSRVFIIKPNSPVSIENIADKIGTSPYEVMTSLSPTRIFRTYS